MRSAKAQKRIQGKKSTQKPNRARPGKPEATKSQAASPFGLSIKAARIQLGWSQGMLAHKASVSLATVQNIELDRANPSLQTLQALCDCLGLKISIESQVVSISSMVGLGVPLLQDSVRTVDQPRDCEGLIASLVLLARNKTELLKSTRDSEALASFCCALNDHFPSVWVQVNPQIQDWYTQRGKNQVKPKLRRLAVNSLAEYL